MICEWLKNGVWKEHVKFNGAAAMRGGVILHPCLIVCASCCWEISQKEGAFIAFHALCVAQTINHIQCFRILGNNQPTNNAVRVGTTFLI